MDFRDGLVHGIEDCPALLLRQLRQSGIPEHAPGHEIHDVEHAADDRIVHTQRMDPRYRNTRTGQRIQDTEFAIDGMRTWQDVPDGLAPQNVVAGSCVKLEGRIGLAAGKAFDPQGTAIVLDMLPEPRLQPIRGDFVPLWPDLCA